MAKLTVRAVVGMERAARDPAGLDLATATEIPEAENLEATEGDLI